nr:MAG TPA: hypothetical protein [Caudoviricetes sp.]DAJ65179.1 MAG TPA: hypothetical protein [Caudoviricetes sp.]
MDKQERRAEMPGALLFVRPPITAARVSHNALAYM